MRKEYVVIIDTIMWRVGGFTRLRTIPPLKPRYRHASGDSVAVMGDWRHRAGQLAVLKLAEEGGLFDYVEVT